MSKHIVEQDQPDGSKIEIQVGWDAPMQCFYFVVQKLNPPEFEEGLDKPILSNLYLKGFRDITLGDIKYLMLSHNIELPEALYSNVQKDREMDVVNQIR